VKRYSCIDKKTKREIVLLKGSPCRWGKCSFCDYTADNSCDESANITLNESVLDLVTGQYGVLEVINSGNIFELPDSTINRIKQVIIEKGIHGLFFESHWIYREKIQSMRDFFSIPTIVKTGLESFDRNFREQVLRKGFHYNKIDDLKTYFDSVCLLVAVEGQKKEMIEKDIALAMEHFDHFTVNVYVENSTPIKPDYELRRWFSEKFSFLDDIEKCDVLWVNTDFGVGN